MNFEAAVVVMAKMPQAGKSKTRLSPPLTPQGAARLAEALLKDTLSLVSGLDGLELAVAFTPLETRRYFENLAPPGTLLLPVMGTDLGECLVQALEGLLLRGYRKAIALNADGPSLPPEYLLQAADSLNDHDLVLGPSQDGGYYLVGLKQMHTALFKAIPWSTAQVLRQTLDQAAAFKLRVAQTPEWYDVDTVQDLARLEAELTQLPLERLGETRAYLRSLQERGS